jgi:hypothetical protein
MRRLIQGRGALLAAFILGVAIATAATAGAAGLISGRDVKDGTIGLADLTPKVKKQITAPGPRGRVGPQGATGPAGPAGPAGPLTTVLPAGQTLRGAFNLDAAAAAGGASVGQGLSFGLSLRTAPTLVIRAPTDPATAQCPGSVGNPTAANGVLCVYVSSASANTATTAEFPTGLRVIDFPSGSQGANVFGAEMFIFSSGAGRFFVDGTWAVTGN